MSLGPWGAGPGRAGPGDTVPLPPMPAAPLIDLQGVWVRYPGAAQAALGPANLAVGHAELLTVTGPAGSGKSTLLSVIGLLRRPSAGRYLLNGIDTAALGDGDLAALRGRHIGWIFQRPQLVAVRTALDNVAIPLLYSGMARAQRRDAAAAALDRVGLAGAGMVCAGRLSAGQQQAVAVARAIVTEPNLLLCDEPAASLDQAAAARIIGLLSSLRSAGTAVLIASAGQLPAVPGSRRISLGAAGIRPGTR